MPSAKTDARWRDGILLTIALWVFVVLMFMPVIVFHRHSGQGVGIILLDAATIIVSIMLGLMVFAAFRATLNWPVKIRTGFLAFSVFAAAIAQTAFDLIYSALITESIDSSWATSMTPPYEKVFRYLLVFGVNLALFQVAFSRRNSQSSERQLTDARAAAQHAQLEALRYQLNPHFLFNTLNSISSLIVTRRNDDAEQMTNKLSSFLRSSLTCDPAGLITLDEELALIEDYLDIEAVRFGQRLNVEFECCCGAGDVLIPGFLVQPLVENAIKHGVAPSREAVTVGVAATLDDGRLQIVVRNDKVADENRITAGGAGVGLSNVRRRLQAVFGESARLTALRDGDGYTATITIPCVKARA